MSDEPQRAKNEMLNKYREQLIVIANGIFLAIFGLGSKSIFEPCMAAAGSFLMLSLVSALLTPLFVHRHYLVETTHWGGVSLRSYWSFAHSLLPFAAIYFLFASWPAFYIFSVSVLSCHVLMIAVAFYVPFFIFSALFAYVWKPKEASLNRSAFIAYQLVMAVLVLGACYLPILANMHKTQAYNESVTISMTGEVN